MYLLGGILDKEHQAEIQLTDNTFHATGTQGSPGGAFVTALPATQNFSQICIVNLKSNRFENYSSGSPSWYMWYDANNSASFNAVIFQSSSSSITNRSTFQSPGIVTGIGTPLYSAIKLIETTFTNKA